MQRNDGYGYSLMAKTDATGTPSSPRNASRPALYLTGLKGRCFTRKLMNIPVFVFVPDRSCIEVPGWCMVKVL
ncbi:hypothetical protein AwPolaro_00730 [Polaromonas sp.]|nr:hypothetical protein AwPolaro_00730 [Polaromonas sp.]